MDTLVLVLIALGAAAVMLLAVLIMLSGQRRALQRTLEDVRRLQDSLDGMLRQISGENRAIWDRFAEFSGRAEDAQRSEETRQALDAAMRDRTAQLTAQLESLGTRLDHFSARSEERARHMSGLIDEKLALNEQRMRETREAMTRSLDAMRSENQKKLEEMRQTVDEKLHTTLDKRLNDSFSVLNKRLEEVWQGLGEMRALAGGVNDLKKVLTNVKSRGIWGESQLSSLLEQMLSPTQYEVNCAVIPGRSERVEFAVRLPGRENEQVLLPIDAKFPLEDYQRLLSALEGENAAEAAECSRALKTALLTEGKRISSKYILPPYTTDFAIMFLPVEGLYAEVLRSRGLAEEMQEKYRVIIAGPTTLTALLTSLQVGFRTLAIEKRSGEVWELLSGVKTEFGRFSELIDSARKRLQSASDTLEQASRRSKGIQQKLRDVETIRLPGGTETDETAEGGDETDI